MGGGAHTCVHVGGVWWLAGTARLASDCAPAAYTHCLCLQTIADMIVFNKSRREARSRLVARSWERPYLKFKVGY